MASERLHLGEPGTPEEFHRAKAWLEQLDKIIEEVGSEEMQRIFEKLSEPKWHRWVRRHGL